VSILQQRTGIENVFFNLCIEPIYLKQYIRKYQHPGAPELEWNCTCGCSSTAMFKTLTPENVAQELPRDENLRFRAVSVSSLQVNLFPGHSSQARIIRAFKAARSGSALVRVRGAFNVLDIQATISENRSLQRDGVIWTLPLQL
jgi:hypothetical protein